MPEQGLYQTVIEIGQQVARMEGLQQSSNEQLKTLSSGVSTLIERFGGYTVRQEEMMRLILEHEESLNELTTKCNKRSTTFHRMEEHIEAGHVSHETFFGKVALGIILFVCTGVASALISRFFMS